MVAAAAKALLLLSALPSCLAATREIWYNVTYATANPDGLFEKQVIGLNGTWPPPPIEVNETDRLIVHALNGLDTNTAIHHHGMFFTANSFYDGAVGVTQCGIPPGQTFTYVVNVTAYGQYGTYWYHSHVAGQYADGLRAPFIIHRTNESYKYDEEYTVNLYDWYHESQPYLIPNKFLTEANPTGAEPVPNSAIIQYSRNEKYLPGFNENSTLSFTPGKTYRLRIINMSALAMFSFWIDGHNMTVIEVDGTDVNPYPLDLVTVSVAQRVSVLVTARNDTNSNWLVHANMSPDMFDTVPDDLNLNITSTIVYNTSAPTPPGTTVDEYTMFPDQLMVPLAVEAQHTADTSVTLDFAFDTADNGINRAFFNNITYQIPVVPSYLTAVSMGQDAWNPVVYGQTNTYVFKNNDWVQFTIVNYDAGFHPFHLHGYKFQLVSESMDVSSNDTSVNPAVPEGLANPMRRDTVMIPPGGSRSLRFKADNPVCTAISALESGLAATFVVAPDIMQKYVGAPTTVVDQCRALGFATSGNAAGWNSTTVSKPNMQTLQLLSTLPQDFTGLTTGPWIQQLGWHPKGIGALAACIITALLGMATVIWYAFGGALDEEDLKSEVAAEVAKKEAQGTKAQRVKNLFSFGRK